MQGLQGCGVCSSVCIWGVSGGCFWGVEFVSGLSGVVGVGGDCQGWGNRVGGGTVCMGVIVFGWGGSAQEGWVPKEA